MNRPSIPNSQTEYAHNRKEIDLGPFTLNVPGALSSIVKNIKNTCLRSTRYPLSPTRYPGDSKANYFLFIFKEFLKNKKGFFRFFGALF
jgi:hypothetical protein